MGELGRVDYILMRLADPVTGEIPDNIRVRELAFASKLPKKSAAARGNEYLHLGPYNVGGRTRAFAIDINNSNVLLAGGVSGGMYRSSDRGATWQRVTGKDQHPSVSCLIQDKRPGKSHRWYYGTGEGRGNSAGRLTSLSYPGTGIYLSEDSGKTWMNLDSTNTQTPQLTDDWDIVWNIALDETVDTTEILYAAIRSGIMRSEDGGVNWNMVLGGINGFSTSNFTDVIVTSDGIAYASVSSGGISPGLFRSEDGINWVNIGSGVSEVPSALDRLVIAQVPSNPDQIYFLGETPGSGQKGDTNGSEYNSLLRYTYLSGDGSGGGGRWENFSLNLPYDTTFTGQFKTQGSYDILLTLHPTDTNIVLVGGTNLFASYDAFKSDSNTVQIGGYRPGGEIPLTYRWINHHPDQHVSFFDPSDPNVLYNANDGGVYRLNDIYDTNIVWDNLNSGFYTTQFYTIGIDQRRRGREVVFGGLQDNGTFFTPNSDPMNEWVSPWLGDGSFCAAGEDEDIFYFSSQNGRVVKAKVDERGDLLEFTRIDPEDAGSYLFINPFVLDPNDPNTIYLSEFRSLWRNTRLDEFVLDSSYEKTNYGWEEYRNAGNSYISTIEVSYDNPKHRVYFGTTNKGIYIEDGANSGVISPTQITNNISFGGYTADIAVDPRDADKVIVVFSNYQTQSLYYSEDAGLNWTPISGNLEAEQAPGSPPTLALGDGPSVTSCVIVPTVDGTRYYVGTSVGLFSTDELMGDTTVWVQESPNRIGNIPIDQLIYRVSDGFMAIATHGNGVYTTYVDDYYDITSVDEHEEPRVVKVWPNPSKGQIRFRAPSSVTEVRLFDLNGRQLKKWSVSGQIGSVNTSELSTGTYLLKFDGPSISSVRKVMIND